MKKNKKISVEPDKDGFYDIFTMIDDDPDGASIEIKDRRSFVWREDLFISLYRGWCNYIVELTENGDVGIVESYHCKNQSHALKVYRTICEKKDFNWAKKYLTDLCIKADIKHFKKNGRDECFINGYIEREEKYRSIRGKLIAKGRK
jgi:hypothetical protein